MHAACGALAGSTSPTQRGDSPRFPLAVRLGGDGFQFCGDLSESLLPPSARPAFRRPLCGGVATTPRRRQVALASRRAAAAASSPRRRGARRPVRPEPRQSRAAPQRRSLARSRTPLRPPRRGPPRAEAARRIPRRALGPLSQPRIGRPWRRDYPTTPGMATAAPASS